MKSAPARVDAVRVEPIDKEANDLAARQRYLLTRLDALDLGGDDSGIRRRVTAGRWIAVQAGVYQVDRRPATWEDRLMAATMAAGEGAFVSHRAALILWGLDGIRSALVEITVPHSHGPVPEGTIVHRTRRPVVGTTLRQIPVTSVERTLLDCASMLPPLIIAKAVESALRRRFTTVDRLYRFVKEAGGRGVRGTRRLRRVLNERVADTPTDSGAETEALYHMRRRGVPEPVVHHRFEAEDGTPIVVDCYWNWLNKAIEIDGLDAHDSADKLDSDLQRQNKLMDLGVDLRRFSARLVRRDPERFVREVRRFLEI